jgi:hypothetical protein
MSGPVCVVISKEKGVDNPYRERAATVEFIMINLQAIGLSIPNTRSLSRKEESTPTLRAAKASQIDLYALNIRPFSLVHLHSDRKPGSSKLL